MMMMSCWSNINRDSDDDVGAVIIKDSQYSYKSIRCDGCYTPGNWLIDKQGLAWR